MHYGTDPREYLYEEQTDAVDQANALLSNLCAERGRWRGNPVMTAKLDRLVAMAERRVRRRINAELAHWRYEERDARALDAIAAEDMVF